MQRKSYDAMERDFGLAHDEMLAPMIRMLEVSILLSSYSVRAQNTSSRIRVNDSTTQV